MKGFAGSQDLCEKLTRPNPQHETKNKNNNTPTRDLSPTKDRKHIPEWDKKIQREFEAKNPGPLRHSKAKVSPEVITISDDEPEEQLGKMDDDWTNAIWDELVRDKPQRWDMHDALRLGRAQIEDPSIAKHKRSRSSSPSKEDVKMDAQKTGTEPRQVLYRCQTLGR